VRASVNGLLCSHGSQCTYSQANITQPPGFHHQKIFSDFEHQQLISYADQNLEIHFLKVTGLGYQVEHICDQSVFAAHFD
jgi:hypothetical protein